MTGRSSRRPAGIRTTRSPAGIAARLHRRGVLLLLVGVAGVQFGVGAALVAATGSSPPDLTLTSDATGAALVRASDLAPGHPVVRCLTLSYGNAVAGDRLELAASPSGSLADHLSVRVDAGSGGSSTSCRGFSGATVFSGTLTDLGRQHGSAQDALSLRTLTSGNGTVTARLRFALDGDNGAQGQSAAADLLWVADALGDRTPPPPVVTPVEPPAVPTPPTAPTPTPTPPAPSSPAPAEPAPATPAPATPAPVVTAPAAPAPSAPAHAPTEPAVPTTPASSGTFPRAPEPSTSPSPAAVPPTVPVSGASASSSPTPAATAGSDSGPGSSGGGPVGLLGRGAAVVGHALGSAATSAAHVIHNQVVKPVSRAARPVARGAGYGLGGTAPLLCGFLLIQSRIDRRDPKLALAPTYADPDLAFDHIPRGPLKHRGNAP